jgi:hypothetical protein
MATYNDAFFELPAIFKDPTNPVDAADAKELTELREQLQDDWYEDMDDLSQLDEGGVSRLERQAQKESMKDREKRGRYIRKRVKWLCKATYAQRKEAQEREKRKEEERAAVSERQRELERQRAAERAHYDTEDGLNLLGQSNMWATVTVGPGLGEDLGFQLDEYGGGQL